MAGHDGERFVVTGKRRNGTVTYLCPDASWALRKLKGFEQAEYTEITVRDPEGRILDEAALTARLDGLESPELASA